MNMRRAHDADAGPRAGRGRAGGYALIFALLLVVALSLAATVAIGRAQLDAQRERETQLLWIGNQFRKALLSYHSVNPAGGQQQYPQKLEDLLDDERGPVTVRHLRQLYVDPMTGAPDWVPELQAGRIVGVHSRSKDAPLRHVFANPADAGFGAAKTYEGWRFLATDAVDYVNPLPALATATPPGQGMDATPAASDSPPPPQQAPDPVAAARAQCYAQYGKPNLVCAPDDGACRMGVLHQLDSCLAATSGN